MAIVTGSGESTKIQFAGDTMDTISNLANGIRSLIEEIEALRTRLSKYELVDGMVCVLCGERYKKREGKHNCLECDNLGIEVQDGK